MEHMIPDIISVQSLILSFKCSVVYVHVLTINERHFAFSATFEYNTKKK